MRKEKVTCVSECLSRPTEAERTRADEVGGRLFEDNFRRVASLLITDDAPEAWPGLGDEAGLRGGFDDGVNVEWHVVENDDDGLEGVFGADWSSKGTFKRIVLAFSSWTNLEIKKDKFNFYLSSRIKFRFQTLIQIIAKWWKFTCERFRFLLLRCCGLLLPRHFRLLDLQRCRPWNRKWEPDTWSEIQQPFQYDRNSERSKKENWSNVMEIEPKTNNIEYNNKSKCVTVQCALSSSIWFWNYVLQHNIKNYPIELVFITPVPLK